MMLMAGISRVYQTSAAKHENRGKHAATEKHYSQAVCAGKALRARLTVLRPFTPQC